MKTFKHFVLPIVVGIAISTNKRSDYSARYGIKLLNMVLVSVFVLCGLSSTTHATSVHVMLETNADTANDLSTWTYGSIDDIISNTIGGLDVSDISVSPAYSTTGITHDSEGYRIMFEKDADNGGFLELGFLSYENYDDLVDDKNSKLAFTGVGVSSGYSTTGITFDGGEYHVMYERDTDILNGFHELAIGSFGSFDDIITNTFSNFAYTSINVITGYSTTGITFDSAGYHIMFESDEDIANGAFELAFGTYESIGHIISDNPSNFEFAKEGVLNGFSTTGIVSVVPIPAALPLMGTGLALMGFMGWRRKRKAAVTV